MRRASLLKRFVGDERAAVLLEFAFALPVLLLLFFGVYEISRYLLYRERLESSAIQILDLITQSTNVDAASLDNLYATLPTMMEPYQLINPRIIITQIVLPPGVNCKPVALWQFRPGGSKVAPIVGQPANLDQIRLTVGDNVMSIEVTADYQPISANQYVSNLLGQYGQYVQSFGHTRYGSFNINPNNGQVVTAPCVP